MATRKDPYKTVNMLVSVRVPKEMEATEARAQVRGLINRDLDVRGAGEDVRTIYVKPVPQPMALQNASRARIVKEQRKGGCL